MNWKGCGSKRPWPNLMYYTGICLDRPPGRETFPGDMLPALSPAGKKKLGQGSRSPDRERVSYVASSHSSLMDNPNLCRTLCLNSLLVER